MRRRRYQDIIELALLLALLVILAMAGNAAWQIAGGWR